MSRKIQSTKNYRMFNRSSENRPLELKRHKRLMGSMKLYGFLEEFPIVAVRDSKGNLTVKDGQHRLSIAETLGLPVHWVEQTKDWDVAVVNSTAKTWVLKDYAQRFAANGRKDYQEGIDFADQHHLSIGLAFSLLYGTTSFTNCQEAFIDGTFKIKDRAWANAVAGIYGPLSGLAPNLRNARFIEACMAVCRVDGFDAKRLLSKAERCREKLVPYSTKDACLTMLEQVYNFQAKALVPLKMDAEVAMRKRNIGVSKKTEKNGKPQKAAKETVAA